MIRSWLFVRGLYEWVALRAVFGAVQVVPHRFGELPPSMLSHCVLLLHARREVLFDHGISLLLGRAGILGDARRLWRRYLASAENSASPADNEVYGVLRAGRACEFGGLARQLLKLIKANW
jgi:hypothetical protein